MLPASTPGTKSARSFRPLIALTLIISLIVIPLSQGFDWILPTAQAAAPNSELFFSEYIEGSSNNKALEIYNPTASDINLAAGGYSIQMFFNGSTSAGLTINLTGTIPAGGTYVVAQSSAAPAILAVAQQTNGSGWFNGDDAVVLRKGAAFIDVIGQVGVDPGTEWGTGLTSTADNTIRRKSTITEGDPIASDAFNPSVQWDGFLNDTIDNLGCHGGICLSISDASIGEGDFGTTTLTFNVRLTGGVAGASGVSFTASTSDQSANAGSDYVALFNQPGSIPAGGTSTTVSVTINGDLDNEPNETFLVTLSNIVGAIGVDRVATGTINNDDIVVTFIHEVQGNGGSSPKLGQSVSVRGIVTGRKSNGFFVQEEDVDVDTDPMTSEGIFVFTSSAPPAAAAFGALVTVTGTVAEFVPSADPFQPPLTELTSPTVVQLSTGNALPTPVLLTSTFPNPAGSFDQLERVEGMRVQVNSLTVVGPTDGSFNEVTGSSSSNGRFYGVVTGVARPFREAGIQAPDPAPSGSIPPIPRWDFNPERLKVESAALGQPALTVKSSDTVGPIVGPVDYGFRAYAILPDGTETPVVTPGTLPTVVAAPVVNDATVATFNLNRLFNDDDTDGPAPDVAASVYNNRLAKASKAIREHMLNPDIVGVQEVENLDVLQALAARISSDAIAEGEPDPLYVAYVEEGNDVGGIDVGFLVKTSEIAPGLPRVSNVTVTQEGKNAMWLDPAPNALRLLNDRPPLVLEGTVNLAPGFSRSLTVINNHLRSLNDIESNAPSGLTTEGDRVRKKRQAQAEFLANLVQTRQSAAPSERIVLVGDFNAFEVNDGFADVIGTIIGQPSPDNETAVPNDGVDLVNPDLDNLVDTPPPAERYSYVHEGNAQNLDHVIVNQALINSTSARRIEHPRIDADYPETERNNPATAIRVSDHDPAVAYLTFLPPSVDLSISKEASPEPVVTGSNVTYTITVTNNSTLDPALDVVVNDTLDPALSFVSCNAPGGLCGATGNNHMVNFPSIPAGESRTVTLVATVSCSLANNTVINNSATVSSSTADPDSDNNSDSAATTASNPPPVISGASVDKPVLSVPNHKMVAVAVNYNVSDNCGGVTTALSVSSNEQVNGTGDGDTSPDWQVIDTHNVLLRAERSGDGTGRIYTITITATDSGGNTSTQTITVSVPKGNK